MSSNVVDMVNEIGTENIPTDTASDPSEGVQTRIKAVKNQRFFWMIGGIISLVPPLIIGLIRFFVLESSLNTIIAMLSNTSIMYTGVTLMVSALNDLDFTSPRDEVKEKVHQLVIIYMLTLLVCVMTYSVTETMVSFGTPDSIQPSYFRTGFIIVLNFICVAVPAWLGWKQYDWALACLSTEV